MDLTDAAKSTLLLYVLRCLELYLYAWPLPRLSLSHVGNGCLQYFSPAIKVAKAAKERGSHVGGFGGLPCFEQEENTGSFTSAGKFLRLSFSASGLSRI